MSAIHRDDSHLNGSLYVKCPIIQDYTDAGLSITSIFLLGHFVVCLPVNVWVSWLIFHGTREALASELYLLNLAFCEIINCLGLPAQMYCMYSVEHDSGGFSILLGALWLPVWVGRPMFQTCICVERYIAVVHPLIYIRFKTLKYKVAQCSLAWCALFLTIVLIWTLPADAHIALTWFIATCCILLFCYLSILCSLNRSGPGEGGRGRSGDKTKRKAINIIFVHLTCFLLNYLPLLITQSLRQYIHISGIITDLFNNLALFCGLVQPLLYLHRTGKVSCVREH